MREAPVSASPSTTTSIDPPRGFFGRFGTGISQWGKLIIDSVMALGDFSLFVFRVFGWLVTRLPRNETIWPNFHRVGVSSVPVIAITGTFIGMVLALQSYFQFRQLGLETRLGAVINLSLLRELGPVLAATMLAGRVGSAIAAELGTMRVTEQIDALASMGANPIHYLVVPRFLACFFLIPTLTLMADFMGVCGGHFYTVNIVGVDIHHYWDNSQQMVEVFDLVHGLIKSVFFGTAIALVSCYQGFNCDAGAEGVGRASTAAFVYSFVMILMLDLGIGILLDSFYFAVYPEGSSLV